MSDEDGYRKYLTEFGLIVTVCGSFFGRQQELQKVPAQSDPRCHLYIVSTKPRLSIDPSSVELKDGELKANLRMQRGPSFDEYPIQEVLRLGEGEFTWDSEWPHEEFAIRSQDGTVAASGVVGLLFAYIRDWPSVANEHDVVYIGQAYGRNGDRTAWDRLKRHETVQKILAETSPDRQVWLTLASISDLNASIDIDPRVKAERSNEDDDAHINQVADAIDDPAFWERDAVSLAEAGLIKYFAPVYNDRLKYNFPARDQVPLEAVRSLDFHNLVIELQGEPIRAAYGSATRNYAQWHSAGFAVHQERNRGTTLGLQAATRSIKPKPERDFSSNAYESTD